MTFSQYTNTAGDIRYRLHHPHGIDVRFSAIGAAITELYAPDRQGHYEDVVLGYNTDDEYRYNPAYLGVVVGPFGNRIAKGQFRLDGAEYQLSLNDGCHSLHGGCEGVHRAEWRAEEIYRGIRFCLDCRHGQDGYPGNRQLSVCYQLIDPMTLEIRYELTTDQPTICNLTQHSYFNLTGHAAGSVLAHRLTIEADYFLPITDECIPTGEIHAVEQTPFDFRTPRPIEQHQPHLQLANGKGYDHNFVLRHPRPYDAQLHCPQSGRQLTINSDCPGLQLYPGNLLTPTEGKQGQVYNRHQGVCLETQQFPDAPNQAHFPDCRIRSRFDSRTEWRFSCK